MNRLAPTIRRRTRTEAAFVFPPGVVQFDLDVEATWVKDAKLFVTGWVTGLVFFGTLIA